MNGSTITLIEHYSRRDHKGYGQLFKTDIILDGIHVVTYNEYEIEQVQGFLDAIKYLFVNVEIEYKRMADQ